MTYSAVYCALITKRLQNPLTRDDCYVERHHIIPKSEGGLDEPDNLVNLTAREHYIAHLLLAKIYNDAKMYSAVMYMMTGFHKNRKFKFNSRVYKKMREDYSQRASVERKGINKGSANGMYGKSSWDGITPEQRARRVESSRRSFLGKHHTDETKKRISEANSGTNSAWYGKHHTEEQKRKIGLANIGKHNKSEAEKQAHSLRMKGRHLGKHWFNDGTKCVFDYQCPEGFVAGRLRKK